MVQAADPTGVGVIGLAESAGFGGLIQTPPCRGSFGRNAPSGSHLIEPGTDSPTGRLYVKIAEASDVMLSGFRQNT